MKFGGTSVQDSAAIAGVTDIIRRTEGAKLIVISACAGITNMLTDISGLAKNGDLTNCKANIEALQNRHFQICESLFSQDHSTVVRESLKQLCAELLQLVTSVSVLKELTGRSLDQILSFGERLSSLIVAEKLKELGVAAALIDARSILMTNDSFGSAAPLFKSTKRNARKILLPLFKQGVTSVTQGFIGGTTDGLTTTLGRGGSDFSASVLGSVLDAEEIQIWTDVEGILTADPFIIPEANPIPRMSFHEASELAYFGAKVLHPKTIFPAVRKNIPVRVLNSKKPHKPGTLITNRPIETERIVKSIAYKEGMSVLKIQSPDMLMSPGYLSDVLQIFANRGICVDVVATSLVGISLAVHHTSIDSLIPLLEPHGEVSVEKEKAICCVVGERLKQSTATTVRAISALQKANVIIDMLSLGGSDINLTFVVDQHSIRKAVEALHSEFFEKTRVRKAFLNGVMEAI